MDKRKSRKFRNRQKRLAKKIAEAHGCTNFTVHYEQELPDVYTDLITGKVIIRDKSQIIFPEAVTRKGKRHRLIVVMQFQGICNRRTVGKIIKRPFWIRNFDDSFEIITSVNPHQIAK